MILMNEQNIGRTIDEESRPYFAAADEARALVESLLRGFNDRRIRLFDLPACQRIFLFILTRSVKTYSSIMVLCRQGYGQDVATLLRGFLENLITARFILHDAANANHLAERFVAYKWIIFKRSLPERELDARRASKAEKKEFYKRKALVMRHVDDFKKKFGVISDRALISWSGKTVRDMAKEVDEALLVEYDSTFRQCSKFSHPCILGDQEYMIQDNRNLTFSPLPSRLGVLVNLRQAIKYFLEFAALINAQFHLDAGGEIDALKRRFAALETSVRKHGDGSPSAARTGIPLRECTVVFELDR